MKEKIMSHLPFIYAYYTIIVFVTCAANLIAGYNFMETGWFIELFVFLVVFTIFDTLMGNINFKSFLSCALAESVAGYILFMIFSYFFEWVDFTPEGLLYATILFIIIVVIGISYMNYQHKLRTKELNESIQRQHS